MTVKRTDSLPCDDRTGLPIPWSAGALANGRPAFSVLDPEKVLAAATKGLCGVCGQKLEYWIAFLGGPMSARSGQFVDPPMHVECAAQSLELCPHIAAGSDVKAVSSNGPRAKRTPTDWFLYVCRAFVFNEGDPGGAFHAKPAKRIERYTYVNGVLRPAGKVEQSAVGAGMN